MMTSAQENAVESITERIMAWPREDAEATIFMLAQEADRLGELQDKANSLRLDHLSKNIEASSERFTTLIELISALCRSLP